MTTYDDTLAESSQISQTEALSYTANTSLSENILTYQYDIVQFIYIIVENLELTGSFTETQLISIIEAIVSSDALSDQADLYSAIADNVDILDLILVITQALATESITTSATLNSLRRTYRYLTDILSIADTSGTAANLYAAIITAAMVINDSEVAIKVLALSDGIGVDEAIENYISMARAIVEAMEMSDTGEPSISFFSVVTDEFFTDSQFDTMQSFIAEIQDGFQFTTVISGDGESWVGYVINPEGYAVTTYDNYKFNSIGYFNRNYIGAASTGLYEIGGTDDDGTYIISKLLTAVMDFGTSNRKYVPTVYLGVVNDSKLVLKVSVDGKSTSYYELTPESHNLDTQYIKIGKGLVGRYWQFELITKQNEGLDLDSIEFFPLSMGRKI